MSNYSPPITKTGSLISFEAVQGGVFDSLSIPITPTQNLNGYSKPWAGGANVNLLPDVLPANTINASVNSSGNIVSAPNARLFAIPCKPNTYYTYQQKTSGSSWTTISFADDLPQIGGTATRMGSMTNRTAWKLLSGAHSYMLIGFSSEAGFANDVATNEPIISEGESYPSYSPFKNVCPITGLSSLSVYVSPTQNQADATTYALSFTEVPAGSIDPVLGVIKRRPAYSSYNGETLTGPWLSSLDEYASGTTPTTGAQVVDLGGTETSESITPEDMEMLTGQNYIWASTSAVLTLIYRIVQTARQIGATSIGKNAASLLVSPQFNGYSKVILNVTEELYYEAGNDTGRTLTIDCPWATQQMANNLLSMLEGFQYQPYEAESALIDPAAELGDGLTVNGVYGGIFKMTIRASVLHDADVGSPQDEEIDHEYQFIPSSERKIERRLANVQSELSVQADQIAAKVDREGGDPSSVSWEMNADQFVIKADGTDVLTVDENGLTVNGDGNFTGEVHAGNIKYGGSSGHMGGGGIRGGSLGNTQLTEIVNTSLANGDRAIDAMFNNAQIQYTNTQWLTVRSNYMKLNGASATWRKQTFSKPGGATETIWWLGQGGEKSTP